MKPECDIIEAVGRNQRRRDAFFAFLGLMGWIAGVAILLMIQAECL